MSEGRGTGWRQMSDTLETHSNASTPTHRSSPAFMENDIACGGATSWCKYHTVLCSRTRVPWCRGRVCAHDACCYFVTSILKRVGGKKSNRSNLHGGRFRPRGLRYLKLHPLWLSPPFNMCCVFIFSCQQDVRGPNSPWLHAHWYS